MCCTKWTVHQADYTAARTSNQVHARSVLPPLTPCSTGKTTTAARQYVALSADGFPTSRTARDRQVKSTAPPQSSGRCWMKNDLGSGAAAAVSEHTGPTDSTLG